MNLAAKTLEDVLLEGGLKNTAGAMQVLLALHRVLQSERLSGVEQKLVRRALRGLLWHTTFVEDHREALTLLMTEVAPKIRFELFSDLAFYFFHGVHPEGPWSLIDLWVQRASLNQVQKAELEFQMAHSLR